MIYFWPISLHDYCLYIENSGMLSFGGWIAFNVGSLVHLTCQQRHLYVIFLVFLFFPLLGLGQGKEWLVSIDVMSVSH
jgi:hypothetical protein